MLVEATVTVEIMVVETVAGEIVEPEAAGAIMNWIE